MVKEVEVLCIKDMVDAWGDICFIEGKVYKCKCEKNSRGLFGMLHTFNEENIYHNLGGSMNGWFRKHFRVLHFGNVKEKKKMQDQDSEILDSMIVALKLLGCSVEEHFNKGFHYKYTQIYNIKNKHDKVGFINIHFDKKMRIKEISAVVGLFKDRIKFASLEELFDRIISEF